jgi:hypothetical protein
MATPTNQEIRDFILDRVPADNFLLDDLEFTEEQINSARCLVADKYNSTPPFVEQLTGSVFPYRYEFMLGVASSLLKTKAINMMRNNLNYQNSEGTSINDLEKRREYLELSGAMSQEFDQRVRQIKVSKNAEDCYGYV